MSKKQQPEAQQRHSSTLRLNNIPRADDNEAETQPTSAGLWPNLGPPARLTRSLHTHFHVGLLCLSACVLVNVSRAVHSDESGGQSATRHFIDQPQCSTKLFKCQIG